MRESKAKSVPLGSVGGATAGDSTSETLTIEPCRACVPPEGGFSPCSGTLARFALRSALAALGSGPLGES